MNVQYLERKTLQAWKMGVQFPTLQRVGDAGLGKGMETWAQKTHADTQAQGTDPGQCFHGGISSPSALSGERSH